MALPFQLTAFSLILLFPLLLNAKTLKRDSKCSALSLSRSLAHSVQFISFPLSNCGVFGVWAVKALNEIKASLGWRVVYAWVGDDPCGDGDLPPWSGVTCSTQGDYRVVTELWASVSFDSIVWEYLVKWMSSLILFCKFAGRFMQCQSLGLFLLLSPISWISLGCKATSLIWSSLIYSHSLIYVTRCWIDKLKMQTLRTRVVSVLSKLNTSSLFSRTCYICMWLSPFYRDLHNNKLTGPIPPQIGRLKRLKILYSPFFLLSLFCYKTHAVALIYAILRAHVFTVKMEFYTEFVLVYLIG